MGNMDAVSDSIERECGAVVDEVFEKYKHIDPRESALIPLLLEVQQRLGFLPASALTRVARLLHMSESRVLGVVTFFHQFRLRPKGTHIITVCRGTACHVGKVSEIAAFLFRHLKIVPPEDTSTDGVFTIQQVRCIGACSLAPIMMVDDQIYGGVQLSTIPGILDQYR